MLTQKRNYGIDLLRIVSMIMVVILHILSWGGILNSSHSTSKHSLVWFLEIAAFCSVNCYAMISGYTGYGRNYKPSSIISLWFQVAFYSIGLGLIFKAIAPTLLDIKFIYIFFPVTSNLYWYFTKYFCLFLFIPFLNHLVETLSKKSITVLLITSISLFSIFSATVTALVPDIFGVERGYSVLWLAVLYLLGAYIKKYQFGFNLKKRIWLITYFICVIITLASKLLISFLSNYIGILNNFINFLIEYNSPTMLLAAVSLFVFFANLNLRATFCKIVSFFSASTFSVYIIHLHPNIWALLKNRFVAYADFNIILLALAVIGTALAIWLVCSLVDKIRQLIFKLIKIDVLAAKIANLVQKIIDKIANGLQKLMA